MSMEDPWNYTDRAKPTYSEKTLFQCHYVHHKTQTKCPGIETEPPKYVTATIPFSHGASLKNVFCNAESSSQAVGGMWHGQQAVGGMWQGQQAELHSTRH